MELNKYENYPFWIIALSNMLSISIYAIGAYIIYQAGIIWLVLYLLYILFLEIKLLIHCANCFYYGKYCSFGRGKLSGLFFKKGAANKFCQKQMTWKDMIPDLLLSLIPMVLGIIFLIMDFNWLLLSSVAAIFLLSSVGNGFIRGSFACKYCKQQELGCPADRLFNISKVK